SKVIGDDSMGNRGKLLEEIAGRVNRGFGRNLSSREHPLSAFSILDIPVVGCGRSHLLDEIHPFIRNRACEVDGFVVAHPLASDACPHRSGVAQSACERTSIDTLYSGNSMLKEKIMKISLRAPVARQRAQLFNDEAAHLSHFTFQVEQGSAVISHDAGS